MTATLPWALALALASPTADRPDDAPPTRTWDIEHLDLDIRVDLTLNKVSGTTTHRVAPLTTPSGTLRLNAVGFEVSGVLVDGEPASYQLNDEWLEVRVAPGMPHNVQTSFSGRPETGVHFRDVAGGREAWTQGEAEDHRHWFPSWDHPSDRFTVTTTLTYPKGLVGSANGRCAPTEAPSGLEAVRCVLDAPIVNYLVAFTVGPYDEHLLDTDGTTPLTVQVPRGAPAADVQATFGKTGEMMRYFEELLGAPYPYPLYRQVVVQRFLWGGMENASHTIIADRHLRPADSPALHHSHRVVAHELAHQWFGDLLTCYGWRELWLNEGFATYYAGRWERSDAGDAAFADLVDKWHRYARGQTQPMATRSWSRADSPSNGVYTRGASVLHFLAEHLGQETFDAGIRRWVATYGGQLVETDQLRRVLEDVSGEPLGWVFDQWVYTGGAPTIRSKWRFEDGLLTVELTQEGPPWRIPVTVDLGGGAERRIWLDGPSAQLQVPLDAAPRWVAIDPRGALLATIHEDQSTDSWRNQAVSAASPFARLRALDALGDLPMQASAEAALQRIAGDTHEPTPIRGRAWATLARWSGAAGLAATDPGTADQRARELWLEAAGQSQLSAPMLARAAGTDPVALRAPALEALADADRTEALRVARDVLRRPDPTPRAALTEAALGVIDAHGGAEDLGLVRGALSHPNPEIRAAAAGAAVTRLNAAPRDWWDRDHAALAALLTGWLRSEDLRTRETALQLLTQLRAPEAVPALTAWRATTRIEDHREAVDAAITACRAGPPAEGPVSRDEIQGILDRLGKLEAREGAE